MSNMLKAIIAIVILGAAGAGAYVLMKDETPSDTSTNTSQQTATMSENQTPNGQTGTTHPPAEPAATITYTNSGFEPSDSTIKSGQSVKVVNNSSQPLDFESNVHPIHTDNSELNIGEISPGSSKTFRLTTVGEWGFHNHLDSGHSGHIHVQ
jgi:hypothetical protein